MDKCALVVGESLRSGMWNKGRSAQRRNAADAASDAVTPETRSPESDGTTSEGYAVGNIQHVVVIMLENWSFVDHTVYETVSILALIEHRWGLAPLGTRDAQAADLAAALNVGSLK